MINSNYHQPDRPYFDAVEMEGGGDAISAARAVLQTGEYDYAWNVQVQDGWKGWRSAGIGRPSLFKALTWNISRSTSRSRRRSMARSSIQTVHPTLSDPNVYGMRWRYWWIAAAQRYFYGRSGRLQPIISTARHASSRPTRPSNSTSSGRSPFLSRRVENWIRRHRAKDGRKLQFVFQSSINQPRQQTQQIIKRACQQAGIEGEIKSVVASVFFSSTSPSRHILLSTPTCRCIRPDPAAYPGLWMRFFLSSEIASKANKP